MDVTVSNKYQVVIPKAVRRQLHIVPGQKLRVESDKQGRNIIIKTVRTVDQILSTYAGTAVGAWGADSTATLRRMRDEEWRD